MSPMVMASVQTEGRPEPLPPLEDAFGRIATDLRVSVTDRCNFRCRYCMPAQGLDWMGRSELLSFEEMTRITGILVRSGVRSIKVTGGEPLVRRGVPRLVGMLRDISPELDISLTTNGYLLAQHAAELASAGLDRVTVSCDSLIRHRFAELTLRDALAEVMAGLEVAAKHGLGPIKINTVVMKQNLDEAVSFAALARRSGYEVRFIEYMPLDAQNEWNEDDVIPATRVLEAIDSVYPLQAQDTEGPEPATTYRFRDGAPGLIGVIPSVTAPFCASCNRLRLTADGQLRACLFSIEETDLRGPLRAGATEDSLAQLARACVAAKWAGHNIGSAEFVRPNRSMSMIGG